jgi:hypothetical protein
VAPNVSEVMDDDFDDVEFSEDQEAALLVALLRWRGPSFPPEAAQRQVG